MNSEPPDESDAWEDGYRPPPNVAPPPPRFPWFSHVLDEVMEALSLNPWEAALLSVFISVVLVAIPFVGAFVYQSRVSPRPVAIAHFADSYELTLMVAFPLIQGFLTGFLTSRRPQGAGRWLSISLVLFALNIAGASLCGDEPVLQVLTGLPAPIIAAGIALGLWRGAIAGRH